MTEVFQQLVAAFGSQRVKQQEPLSLHSTMKIGGPAQWYLEVEKRDELIDAVTFARSNGLPFVIVGSGSYTIFPDTGIQGLVIKNNCRKFEMKNVIGKIRNRQLDVEKAYLFAESGVLTNQLVRNVIESGFSGLEYMLGLPGTIGGAVMLNAEYPKHDYHLLDAVFKAEVLTEQGEIIEVQREYFTSSLVKTKQVILSVLFEVYPGHKETLWAKGNEAAAFRTSFEAYGSTYRSLAVSKTDVLTHHGSLPSIDTLLHHAGLVGKQVGSIALSADNSRFILNKGNGTSEEVSALIKLIQKELKNKYNISLDIQMNHFRV